MKEIVIKGRVKEDNGWYLEIEKGYYTADILSGIDEILESHNEEVLHYGEEIEIIIKIKRS